MSAFNSGLERRRLDWVKEQSFFLIQVIQRVPGKVIQFNADVLPGSVHLLCDSLCRESLSHQAETIVETQRASFQNGSTSLFYRRKSLFPYIIQEGDPSLLK